LYQYPYVKASFRFAATIIVAAMAVLCSSCATGRDDYREFDNAPLFGMIYDNDNQPCSGVAIAVDGNESSVSDINGRFIIADLTRGTHKITAVKDGYEALEISIEFLNKSQVLYLRNISFDQLLAKAEQALEREDVQAAEQLLQRARSIRASDPVLEFLTAVYYRRTSSYEEAIATLKSMLDLGYERPAVLLLLADIYEYDLGNLETAREFLVRLLKVQQNKSVQLRIDEITAALGGK